MAIDDENNTVIIECKRIGNFDRDALIQLMEYYSWFSKDENTHKASFLDFEKKGYREVTQDIRLMALVIS